MSAAETDVRRLVAALPEIYQPIYLFPEYDTASSRRSDDRLLPIVRAIQDYPVRNPRVLDLGCAQGYFSFKLSEIGAQVTGVDSLPANIALCRALNANAGHRVAFQEAHVDLEYVKQIADQAYDFVLILNVLHHVCHEHDAAYVKQLLRVLKSKCRIVIMELARREEPMYWAQKLPESPTSFAIDFAFNRQIAEFPTHLSEVHRPMHLCSDSYVYINRKYFAFDRHLLSSHEFEQGAHLSTRRYYFGRDILVKAFASQGPNGELNGGEIEAEAAFLRAHAGRSFVPDLIECESGPSHAILVRKLLPGERLSQFIALGAPYDPERIIADVLDTLVELEGLNLYHHDVRTWNVLVDEQGHAKLIDFGAISEHKSEAIFDEFLTFCYDTIHRFQPTCACEVWPRRAASLYPGRYAELARYLNRTALSGLTFRAAKAVLESRSSTESGAGTEGEPYERLYARLEASVNERFYRLDRENQRRIREIEEGRQADAHLLGDMRNLTIRAQLTAFLHKLARRVGWGGGNRNGD